MATGLLSGGTYTGDGTGANLSQSPEDILNQGYELTGLTPATTGALNTYQQNIGNMPSQLLYGAGNQNQLFNTPSGAQIQGNELGGTQGANTAQVMNAIGQRNARQSTDFVNNLKNQVNLNAPAIEAQAQQQQMQNLMGVNQIALNNYQVMQQYALDQRRVQLFRQQQQDSILAGILGVVGAITGGVIGGALGEKK